MEITLSIKNWMDRETDRQKVKHRDEGILTGGEQTETRFSRVLLGRGSNNTIYTTSDARLFITDCLHRSNSLIVPIRLVFAIRDGRTDGPTDGWTDRPTEWLIESRARD